MISLLREVVYYILLNYLGNGFDYHVMITIVYI